mgnify:CR=1 FL=1
MTATFLEAMAVTRTVVWRPASLRPFWVTRFVAQLMMTHPWVVGKTPLAGGLWLGELNRWPGSPMELCRADKSHPRLISADRIIFMDRF